MCFWGGGGGGGGGGCWWRLCGCLYICGIFIYLQMYFLMRRKEKTREIAPKERVV